MEEEECRDELNFRIRKSLIDWFGPYEEFAEKVSKGNGPRHGLIRSRMKSRSSPYVSLQIAQDASPSHIPVHVALQSMRNLVEEPPLSALPTEFPGFNKKLASVAGTSASNNNGVEKNGKRRKMSSDEEGVGAKRKKEAKSAGNRDESSVTFSPDSGVHSTENDVDESNTVEAMLNIMTSLEEPRLSPISDSFLKEIKKMENDENRHLKKGVKKDEKIEDSKNKKSHVSVALNDGESSRASTSREASPVEEKKHHREPPKEPSNSLGVLRLKHVKPERIQKLVELARKQEKLIGEEPKKAIEEKKENREEKARKETPKPANKMVQQLAAKEVARLSPSVPSPKSSMNTPTPSVLSRPSSSMSTHEPAHTPKTLSENKTPQTVKPARWTCLWEHAKLKSPQRLPIYDKNDPKAKSKAEFYHFLAKDWKGKADRCKDRVLRPLFYMVSSVYFLMEGATKNDKSLSSAMYRDTHDLLGFAVSQGIRDTDDTMAAHLLPRVKIIGQIMLSVMQYQIYILRSESAMKNYQRLEMREVLDCIEIRPTTSTHTDTLSVPLPNKHVTLVAHGTNGPSTSAGSTPSSTINPSPWVQSLHNCPNSATMPTTLYEMIRSQMKTCNSLILASRYWEDSKNLARVVDASFIKHFETVIGKTIGMDMPFEQLAQFVLTAVASLRAEYEEELKQTIRPAANKVKAGLDIAVRTGGFYPCAERPQRPSQSTPQLPPSTRTPTPSSMNLSSK